METDGDQGDSIDQANESDTEVTEVPGDDGSPRLVEDTSLGPQGEVSDADEAADAAPAASPEPPSKRTRLVLIIAAAAVATVALGAGGFAWMNHNQTQAQLAAQAEDEQRQRDEVAKQATGKVESALAELATAQTTVDVQVVANRSADDGLALEEEPSMDSRAQGAAAALSAIAGLKALNADTLDNWPQLRQTVDEAVRDMVDPGKSFDPASALTNIDLVVTRGQEALATWQMEVAFATSAREKENAAVNQYDGQAQAQISRYNQLRNETADWLSRAEESNTYRYSDAVDYFTTGTSERRAVRDSLSALTVPEALRPQHEEILAVLTEAVDGMQSMVEGLEANQRCFGLDCPLASTAGYQRFESQSQAITLRYARAVDNLDAKVAEIREVALQQELPPKPTV